MDITFNRQQFSARYNRIMLLTALVLVLIAAALLYLQSREKIRNEQIRITEEFRNQALALDNLVVSVGEHLNLFQKQAQSYFLSDQKATTDQVFSALQNGDSIYHLDELPVGYNKEQLANLTGRGTLQELSLNQQQEMGMALSLNPLFQAAKENIPDSSWVYYTSQRAFINIYPWVPSADFHYVDELLTHEFYLWGLPDANPFREAFWTPAYIDEAGQGLMVTSAKPVYRDHTFLGTVAIDITVNQLVQFVSSEQTIALGQMMIINSQDQLIAHPNLDSNNDGAYELWKFEELLPTALRNIQGALFEAPAMTIEQRNGYSYIWYPMTNAPWKVLYIYKTSDLYAQYWSRMNIDFVLLILALAVMVYLSNKVTFKEFIHPSEQLVQHIAHESQALEQADANRKVLPIVPGQWLPWFGRISQLFAENRQMVEEIREKNEILLEKNTELERYMPKTVVIISVQPDSDSHTSVANSSFANALASCFAQGSADHGDSKSTVYVEYPDLSASFQRLGLVEPNNKSHHLHQHPNGYDIQGRYDFGDMPRDAHSSLLMNKLLENYSNVVIHLTVQESLTPELEVFLRYAKLVLMMVPSQPNAESAQDSSTTMDVYSLVEQQVKAGIRQDKTALYTVYNPLAASAPEAHPEADFVLPSIQPVNELSADAYRVPKAMETVIEELIDRVERVHQISVFIPTTMNIDEVMDTSEYVERTMAFFGEKFGGATCSEANGVWNSSKGDLVNEVVNLVVSYTTEESLNRHVDDVIAYVKGIKQELQQDAMAIEINKKMILI